MTIKKTNIELYTEIEHLFLMLDKGDVDTFYRDLVKTTMPYYYDSQLVDIASKILRGDSPKELLDRLQTCRLESPYLVAGLEIYCSMKSVNLDVGGNRSRLANSAFGLIRGVLMKAENTKIATRIADLMLKYKQERIYR